MRLCAAWTMDVMMGSLGRGRKDMHEASMSESRYMKDVWRYSQLQGAEYIFYITMPYTISAI